MKKFLLITISFALIFLFSSRIKEDLQTYKLLIDEAENLEQTKRNITKEEEKLEQLLEEGRQGDTLEQMARLMLGLKKKGEEVMMVLPSKDSSNISELQISTSSDPLSKESSNFFFSKILQIWYNLVGKFKK